MKLFSAQQIKLIDKRTIELESISSLELMERVAHVLLRKILKVYPQHKTFTLIAGHANNGGDGLALARLLSEQNYSVTVFLVHNMGNLSLDCVQNMQRLMGLNVELNFVNGADDISLPDKGVIIDALLGSGVNRPLKAMHASIVDFINRSKLDVVSIDLPSGMMAEDNGMNKKSIVRATHTFTLEFPKIALLLPANAEFVGKLSILAISLDDNIKDTIDSPYFFIEPSSASRILKKRNKFAHKGNFGHALIIAGHYGQIGAALLAGKSCLRTGAGLTTVHIPSKCCDVVQSAIPELLTSIDASERIFTSITDVNRYSAVAIGPGLGTKANSIKGVSAVLQAMDNPVVLDADAINIIAMRPEILQFVPAYSIFTPHPKEFSRLTGMPVAKDFDRVEQQIEFSKKYNCYVLLKGAYTSISTPDGRVFFNSTANPGLATAGSGDVLTGIIVSLLAQGYSPEESVQLAVILHGLAADKSLSTESFESLIASDIINSLGVAFQYLHSEHSIPSIVEIH